VAHLHAVLHRAFGQATKWNLIPRNVAAVVDRPRIARHEMARLNGAQVRQLLKTAKGDDLEALYTLAVTTGMREGELLVLRWRDVDLDNARLHVVATLQRTREGSRFTEPKTSHSRRRIALAPHGRRNVEIAPDSPKTSRLAAKRWEDNDLVFANEVGRTILPAISFAARSGRCSKGPACHVSASMTCATPPRPYCWQALTPRSLRKGSATRQSA